MVDLSKFKDLFISEAEDNLQKLNGNLLALEKNLPAGRQGQSKKLLDELMRSAHTMKSSSATMGYKKMAFLTHVLEDIFDHARNDELKITPKIINELFKTVDILEKSLASVKKSGEELNVDTQARKLKKLTGVTTEGVGKSPRTPEEKPATQRAQKPVEDTETSVPSDDLSALSVAKIDHIKVPVERLDNLMDLMEELLIDKMRLEQLKNKTPELEGVVEHLSRLVSDIQYQVMQARLVPVEQIFARFPRMVRDLAQEQKKKIGFGMTGGEMELDRTIVDKLGEPLVHLLRNAVDHGIEKSGTINLQAKREKDFALIMVENDGKNIDFEKVKRAAVKRNIVDAKEIESLSENQLINLLYHPRLSTKDKVTETSGRGVGLSVVKSFVDQIGGRVTVESPITDGGTRFTLELPLTLAIINSLLVEVRDTLFAIPFSSIERSVDIPQGDIKSMADQDVAVVDGVDVPLVYLHKVFNLAFSAEHLADNKNKTKKIINPKSSTLTAVLVKRGKDIAGIVIDKLINEQEIIVKPLPSVLKGTKGFSGSTILGDGRTILILDFVSLLEDRSKLIRTS
ncbi:chemotaxis protein CheA [Patescibacteria group bacterium AH-259-L07]|nr:chemotaxis protein CheA [Patescibacteria group bacterium AH-259-L07]